MTPLVVAPMLPLAPPPESAPARPFPAGAPSAPPSRRPDVPPGWSPQPGGPLPGFRPPPAPSPLQRLEREPTRFTLDQAAWVLAPDGDALSISFRTQPRLGLPAGEVAQANPAARELVAPTFGLIGPGGVLPRHYTAMVGAELRRRSLALHAFVDVLARRFTGLWVLAGAKYRPARDPGPTERALAAAIGLGTPHLAERLESPLAALLFHAGNLANRTGSAERLRGMLEAELGHRVEIEEFVGGWLRLPAGERTRLGGGRQPGQHAALGGGAALGAQVWDPQGRFVIRLGPLRLAQFEALLPGAPLHRRLIELSRLLVGPEQGFALNPVLRADEVPPARLGPAGARMGWTSWLGTGRPRRRDAAEAMFAGGD
ncbi:type VI secretion system baseplate subunit TssG [Roseomonas sp. NAR14]|uniref:Type VI secretion system baseplate subunit TssG n=1 Tax=Roseomonas acroporae TaxID=2937791 RepID=A0A9X1YAJ9_9PROT|nr:type VI secretion system baseplate subunit TssG [Roseomonas acroporae]MCK8785147.1 type VI secretion system baseplate subunit TssG [Roseomonas acroporae]